MEKNFFKVKFTSLLHNVYLNGIKFCGYKISRFWLKIAKLNTREKLPKPKYAKLNTRKM